MSLFGRALGGAGAAVADIANKYIDQNLVLQRAQAVADIQRKSAVQQTQDIDAYTNDPTRRANLRTAAAADEESIGEARNKVGLAGKVAEATSPELRKGEADRAKALAKAALDATSEATNDPLYLKGQRALTEAHETAASRAAAAASGAQTELLRLQTGVARKTDQLQDQIREAVVTGNTGAEEQYRAELAVIQGKPGQKDTAMAVISEAQKAMAPALKIIGDAGSSPQAIEEAHATIRQQRAVIQAQGKKVGIDLEAAAKVPESDAHRDAQAAIKAGAKADDVNKRLVEQGYKPLGEPTTDMPRRRALADAAPKDMATRSKEAAPVLADGGWQWNGRTYKNQAEAYAARKSAIGR